MKSLFWDFFGPNAEATARHFLKHLNEFLERNTISDCETGLSTEGEGHQAVFCRAPEAISPAIERTLRPRRVL